MPRPIGRGIFIGILCFPRTGQEDGILILPSLQLYTVTLGYTCSNPKQKISLGKCLYIVLEILRFFEHNSSE